MRDGYLRGELARPATQRHMDVVQSANPERVRLTRLFDGNPFGSAYGTVTTTLPRLCPLSTYLCASTMSSRA